MNFNIDGFASLCCYSIDGNPSVDFDDGGVPTSGHSHFRERLLEDHRMRRTWQVALDMLASPTELLHLFLERQRIEPI
jgi:hypothetical protein